MASNQLRGCHNNSSDLTVCDSKKPVRLCTYICIHTDKFLTRPTCQFASESGALRWRQKLLLINVICPLYYIKLYNTFSALPLVNRNNGYKHTAICYLRHGGRLQSGRLVCHSVCVQDYCKSNQLILLKLAVTIGPTNQKSRGFTSISHSHHSPADFQNTRRNDRRR